ncbi:MAG: aspartate/glutamate racemase family protein, partial [Novosphingobium sp.]|nr:aspartate/glutamate racemase family protein [Novosphingobium sp.]
LPPMVEEVDATDAIIYDELMQGKATRSAERAFKTMLTNMEQRGAQAVVLACTELDMVIDVDANVLPIYDGTRIHAQAAVDWILG